MSDKPNKPGDAPNPPPISAHEIQAASARLESWQGIEPRDVAILLRYMVAEIRAIKGRK